MISANAHFGSQPTGNAFLDAYNGVVNSNMASQQYADQQAQQQAMFEYQKLQDKWNQERQNRLDQFNKEQQDNHQIYLNNQLNIQQQQANDIGNYYKAMIADMANKNNERISAQETQDIDMVHNTMAKTGVPLEVAIQGLKPETQQRLLEAYRKVGNYGRQQKLGQAMAPNANNTFSQQPFGGQGATGQMHLFDPGTAPSSLQDSGGNPTKAVIGSQIGAPTQGQPQLPQQDTGMQPYPSVLEALGIGAPTQGQPQGQPEDNPAGAMTGRIATGMQQPAPQNNSGYTNGLAGAIAQNANSVPEYTLNDAMVQQSPAYLAAQEQQQIKNAFEQQKQQLKEYATRAQIDATNQKIQNDAKYRESMQILAQNKLDQNLQSHQDMVDLAKQRLQQNQDQFDKRMQANNNPKSIGNAYNYIYRTYTKELQDIDQQFAIDQATLREPMTNAFDSVEARERTKALGRINAYPVIRNGIINNVGFQNAIKYMDILTQMSNAPTKTDVAGKALPPATKPAPKPPARGTTANSVNNFVNGLLGGR